MSNAWVYQRVEQVKELGADQAPWHVGWYEPDGRRKGKAVGPGERGKRNALKLRRKIEAELMTGTYQMKPKVTWEEFRKEYEDKIAPGLDPETRVVALTALEHFRRLAHPVRVFGILTQHIDNYVAARRQERGKKKGSLVSPATINKELRHLKSALRVAKDWGYLPAVPRIRMEKTPKKLPTYVTGDHFAAIYRACEHAKLPNDQPFPAADWWRALVVTGYMTGWRCSDMLGLKRADLDPDAGTAVTRAEDNKGKRDELVKLHPVVVDHLRKLPGFALCVFPWKWSRRRLHEEFAKIQEQAGIHLPCKARGEHEHTPFCHVYGFHDLRRAFASMNADRLTADALQALMRHKSYTTTQVYINLARQMDQAVANLHVPEILEVRGEAN